MKCRNEALGSVPSASPVRNGWVRMAAKVSSTSDHRTSRVRSAERAGVTMHPTLVPPGGFRERPAQRASGAIPEIEMSLTLQFRHILGPVTDSSPWRLLRAATQRRARRTQCSAEVSRMDPAPMDHHEKMRLRAAAFRATRLYPGPVGELLSRELLTWEEFGYRLGGEQLVMRLVDHVLKTPIPQQAPAEADTADAA